MIFDIYNEYKKDTTVNKLVGKNYLILEYKCPVDTEKFQLLTELHFIIYIISGKKDFISAGKTYQAKAGDALFLKKGVYTTTQYFDVDNCVLLFFMNDDFIKDFIIENATGIPDDEKTVDDQIFEIEVNEALGTLFHSVFNYLKMGRNIPRNLVEIKFKELLFNIVLNPNHKKLTVFLTSLNQTNKTSIDSVMMKNFQHDRQLSEFAKLCGRSLSAFKRDFKKIYHQTPGKWLTEKRLQYASTLLLNSDLNINDVCYESGFRNSTHFNKVFKNKYRLPPKQFRTKGKTT